MAMYVKFQSFQKRRRRSVDIIRKDNQGMAMKYSFYSILLKKLYKKYNSISHRALLPTYKNTVCKLRQNIVVFSANFFLDGKYKQNNKTTKVFENQRSHDTRLFPIGKIGNFPVLVSYTYFVVLLQRILNNCKTKLVLNLLSMCDNVWRALQHYLIYKKKNYFQLQYNSRDIHSAVGFNYDSCRVASICGQFL